MSISFRWLGVAGLEFSVNNHVMVIDPYFTRFPLRKLFLGRVEPDRKLIAEKIERCDFVLITHAHFDHLMDVPDVVRHTGAIVMGSANSCRLLSVCGVPDDRIREVKAGDKLTLAEFQVEVFPSQHVKLPGYMPGRLPDVLKPPLRARDYRMDKDLSFFLSVGNLRLLTDPGERPESAVAADVLFLFPHRDDEYCRTLLSRVQPKLVIWTHWDDFFRPLSKPLQPHIQVQQLTFPPLQGINLGKYSRMIERLSPQTKVLVPEIFRSYELP